MKRFLFAFIVSVFCFFSVLAEGSKHDFELYTLGGSLYSTERVRGDADTKIVVVSFFSLYCPPCIKALPEWEKIYKRKGLSLVVVALPGGGDRNEEQKKIHDYFNKNKYGFPIVFDKYFLISRRYGVADKEGAAELPNIFILDKKGKLIYKDTEHSKILKKIGELL